MLVLTVVTAVQRFVKVWRQASVDRPTPRRDRRMRRRAVRQSRAAARAERTRWSRPTSR
jgi:CDP-diacylglycerol--glycerol-3-phosphate 3-phosphatidyltransferase